MAIFQTQLCLYCQNAVDLRMNWERFFLNTADPVLCEKCHHKLELLSGRRCNSCSRELDEKELPYAKDDICGDCLRWEKDEKWRGVLQKNISLYKYNDWLAEIIAQYKYRGDYALAKIFSLEIIKALENESYDLLVPVPLSKERLYERGFNQAEALAKEAGLETADALSRIHSEKQSKKSREERIHLPQVFSVKKPEQVRGLTIMLFDDIYTTGSTIRHAAKALLEAGAAAVSSFTLARG